MALNQIGDKIRDQVLKGVSGIFEPNAKSPAAKTSRESEAGTASQSRPRSPSDVPFNDKQVAWLGNAVSSVQMASRQAFGEAVEVRVQEVMLRLSRRWSWSRRWGLRLTTSNQASPVEVFCRKPSPS